MRYVGNRGEPSASFWIVGEAPGEEEEKLGLPFVGASGKELDAMLAEAGIPLSDCFFTNVCHYRPKDNDIEEFHYDKTEAKRLGLSSQDDWYPTPELLEGLLELGLLVQQHDLSTKTIICLGNTALRAFTGEYRISRWRCHPFNYKGAWLVGTYHPAAVLRQWEMRVIALHDLRKAGQLRLRPGVYAEKPVNAVVRPNFSHTMYYIFTLLEQATTSPTKVHLSVDIETTKGLVACVGISNGSFSICIPFVDFAKPDWSYWPTIDQELFVVTYLRILLQHPNVAISGQNYLYDAQYLAFWLGINPKNVWLDTMIAHHTLFPTLPKGLDFLSSLYLPHHRYWKDEGKEFDPDLHDIDQWWLYNAKDAQYTWEIAEELVKTAEQMGKTSIVEEQMRWWPMLFRTMLRGVRILERTRAALLMELLELEPIFTEFFRNALPDCVVPKPKSKTAKPWWRSNKQQADIFYTEMGIKEVRNRKTWRPTVDDNALEIIGNREPLVQHVTDMLAAYRSVGVLAATLQSKTDPDGRMRCSYNLAGTDTFRLSSSENAFGFGTNLQNITSGQKYSGKESVKRLKVHIPWPNIRRMFGADEGFLICDMDLERADAQVVAWDAGDQELMDIFRTGADVHTENAKAIYGERIIHAHNFKDYFRHKAKAGVHAVNYGVQARTLSKTLNCTVKEAQAFIDRWLSAHPAIRQWQDDIDFQLQTTRTLTNIFGYSIQFLGRMDKQSLSQALAWKPQSTVALVINKIWENFVHQNVDVLLQVHDSLVFQILNNNVERRLKELHPHTRIVVPYPDPLIIPVGLKTSPVSWGDCKDTSWG